jgi:hypothetical protein
MADGEQRASSGISTGTSTSTSTGTSTGTGTGVDGDNDNRCLASGADNRGGDNSIRGPLGNDHHERHDDGDDVCHIAAESRNVPERLHTREPPVGLQVPPRGRILQARQRFLRLVWVLLRVKRSLAEAVGLTTRKQPAGDRRWRPRGGAHAEGR